MALGEEIKKAREEKNLSQEDLAEQLGVSRQAVSKWENGMALPQGINREMLNRILELNIMLETEESDGFSESKKKAVIWKIGWALAAVMTVISLILIMVLARPKEQADSAEDSTIQGSPVPALKTVRFYDKDENIVEAEALWYNAAGIELILLQWEGGTPNSVRVFRIPSGSETMEQMELLLTKSILDGEDFVLLDAGILKDIGMSHLFFELDFGAEIVTSEEYNVFYEN